MGTNAGRYDIPNSTVPMHDSGIEWIGEIPEEWLVTRLKRLLKTNITDGPHVTPSFVDEGIPFLSVDGIQNGELTFDQCRHITEDDHKIFRTKVLPQRDDILMGKAASTGKIARVKVDFEFSIWSPLALIRVNAAESSATFVEYSLKSPMLQAQIDILCTSNTQKNISMDDIPNLLLPFPPLAEQQAIADFLDRETYVIDSLIAKRQRIIDLLDEKRLALISQAVTNGLDPAAPMRDSGIEWIGEIPERWDASRLRFHATIKVSNVDKREIDGELRVRLCNYTDVYYHDQITDDLDFMMATATTNEKRQFELTSGDVLLTKDSETAEDIGVSARVGDRLWNVVLGYHLALLRGYPDDFESRFLHWQLKGRIARDQLTLGATGVTRFGLRQESIANLEVIIAPLVEQHAIADFLDRETSVIDQLKSLNQRQIELLKEKRQAIISAAVTGKIPIARVSA